MTQTFGIPTEDNDLSANGITIGIIGAGPAGLMAALSLEHYLAADRASITILDQNASATDYPGVEYGIQKRACSALEKIGKLEQALIRGNPATEITFYNARLNKHFRPITLDPHYTRAVARQEFLADLNDLLKRTLVLRCHAVTCITHSPDKSVIAKGKVGPSNDDFEMKFDLLIAADGVRSVARRLIWPEESVVYDRGFSCIYMLIEGTPETAPPNFLERANSGRSELVMGDFSTMTLFPLAKGRLALGIGFDHATKKWLWAENGLSPDTEWSNIAPETKKAIAVRLTHDARIEDDLLVKALELVPDWNSYKIYLWAMQDTDPLVQPYVTEANIIAIGDAAHAMLPTIGMGASLAIEDGEALAALIAVVVENNVDAASFRGSVAEGCFIPFTSARHTVWTDLMQRARKAAVNNFIDVGKRKRFAIGPQIPNTTMSRVVTGIESLANAIGV